MSYAEFCDWIVFYSENPFDDEHRYHRPAAMIASSMAGGKVADRLEWLKDGVRNTDDAPMAGQYSEADLKTFAALGLKVG